MARKILCGKIDLNWSISFFFYSHVDFEKNRMHSKFEIGLKKIRLNIKKYIYSI